jgi:hypothetical protein
MQLLLTDILSLTDGFNGEFLEGLLYLSSETPYFVDLE